MQCPVDGTTLAMSERFGVEIDYCPQCRGVWLDRGDKIIDQAEPQSQGREDYDEGYEGEHGSRQGRKRRRFNEFFDGFGD